MGEKFLPPSEFDEHFNPWLWPAPANTKDDCYSDFGVDSEIANE